MADKFRDADATVIYRDFIGYIFFIITDNLEVKV